MTHTTSRMAVGPRRSRGQSGGTKGVRERVKLARSAAKAEASGQRKGGGVMRRCQKPEAARGTDLRKVLAR